MSAHASAPSELRAGGAPQTKFRAPRVRHDTVTRGPLLARLVRSVEMNPVTLVCAPAGSGKTTLLAQLAADASHGMTVLWVALDGDDNSANRLFLALVQAVEPLGLTWESDPRSLGAGLTGPGPQTRAALAAFVNALCTSPARRIVFVFDDLHRLGGRDIGELTEALVERLPDHVALVLGSRVEPLLPLARWRAHGELGEFGPQDLQFTQTDAIALALARFGAVPNEHELRDSLARTHGWAVGMSLMLQARASGGAERASGLAAGSSDRHLFAYLAQEILAELPAALRDFILRSSILTELSPALCEAVTGRSDCVAVLESLYRRNLFLTSIDETTPVLRFHDLFRDFLQDRLQREQPELVAQLHDAAGHAESVPARAIHHFLEARNWKQAAARILQNGERLLLEGAIATLERWIDAIPANERAQMPALGYLSGACGWLRWDWPRAKREMAPAVAGLNEPSQIALKVRALFGLVDALSSSGEQQLAWEDLEAASRIPLDHLGQAHLALQRAWSLTHSGSYEQLPQLMNQFIDHLQHDPVAICPSTAPRVHCLMIGLPGVADAFERFRDIHESLRGATPGPWQIAAAVMGGWAHFWRGNREGAKLALERAEAYQHQFGGVRAVAERLGQFKVLLNAAMGNAELGIELARHQVGGLDSPELAAHVAAWGRPYRHGLARMLWIAGDVDGFHALLPHLVRPKNAVEWPFLDTAADTARGIGALLDEDWPAAQAALERAVRSYPRYRLPMVYADPRLGLAYAYLGQGKKAQAWAQLEPVLREIAGDNAVGVLLLEPVRMVDALLEIVPAEVARETAIASLLERLAQWRGESSAAPTQGPLGVLSEREMEVLAQVAGGASNKHIARALSLSLHTVKRHIANILDKIDCDSRGQAADLYRRHARPARAT
ncbi:MAG TPA: LuxR C-terminal-related transcriptional regulator [Steroidobacteraceae bacterium]|nr:LuxR C-terminal-related transcriptional regulator [Steroidobacteraceae bacterium]